MPDEKKSPSPAPYPHWYVKIDVCLAPGVSVHLDKEGTGFDDFQEEMLSFVANASNNFSYVSPEYYRCPSPVRSKSSTPT